MKRKTLKKVILAALLGGVFVSPNIVHAYDTELSFGSIGWGTRDTERFYYGGKEWNTWKSYGSSRSAYLVSEEVIGGYGGTLPALSESEHITSYRACNSKADSNYTDWASYGFPNMGYRYWVFKLSGYDDGSWTDYYACGKDGSIEKGSDGSDHGYSNYACDPNTGTPVDAGYYTMTESCKHILPFLVDIEQPFICLRGSVTDSTMVADSGSGTKYLVYQDTSVAGPSMSSGELTLSGKDVTIGALTGTAALVMDSGLEYVAKLSNGKFTLNDAQTSDQTIQAATLIKDGFSTKETSTMSDTSTIITNLKNNGSAAEITVGNSTNSAFSKIVLKNKAKVNLDSNYAKDITVDSGGGTIDAAGHTLSGKLTVNSTLTLAGNITLSNGDNQIKAIVKGRYNITNTGTTTVSKGSYLQSSLGTITNSGTMTITTDAPGKTIKNTGTLNLQGTEYWTNSITDDSTAKGKVVIDGAVTTESKITQKDLQVKDSSDSLSIAADNLVITNAVKNVGTITLTGSGKTLNSEIGDTSGTSKTVIDGTITANKKITQKDLQVKDSSDSLNIATNDLVISNSITNAGTIRLTKAGTLEEKISGEGILEIVATDGVVAYTNTNPITNHVVVKNGAKFDPSADVFEHVVVVENGGELYLSEGTLRVDINKGAGEATGGTTFLKANPTSTVAEVITINGRDAQIQGTLNGSGSTLECSEDSAIHSVTVDKLAGTTNLSIDVNMGDYTGDKLVISSDNGATVNVTYINITHEMNEVILPYEEDDKITVVSGASASGNYQVNGTAGELEVITPNYGYTFYPGTTPGMLKYKVKSIVFTFKKFVEGELEGYTVDPATLSMTADMISVGDNILNVVQGSNQDNDAINVNLNNHNLYSYSESTVGVESGKTFNLNGGGGDTAGTVDTNTKFLVNAGGRLNITGNVVVNGDITANDVVSNSGTANLKGKISGSGSIENSGTLTVATSKLGENIGITNSNKMILSGSGTISNAVSGTGKLVIQDGFVQYTNTTPGAIQNDVIIESGATLDPDAGVFANGTTVANYGTLEITGGTLSAVIDGKGGDNLVMKGQMNFAGSGRVVQDTNSNIIVDASLIEADFNDPSKAMFTGVDMGNRLNVSNGNLKIEGTPVMNKYYVLVSGTGVNGTEVTAADLWKQANITFDDIAILEYEVINNMLINYETDLSLQSIALHVITATTMEEANMPGLAGVPAGTFTMGKQIGDAVGGHMDLSERAAIKDDRKYEKMVWAEQIHTKEKVDGMQLQNIQANYTAQYNGTIVGADLYTTNKAIFGAALTYATGKTNGYANKTETSNESKYYGVSVYDRVTNGDTAFIYDIGYLHSHNDITQWGRKKVTADAIVNAYTAGMQVERAYELSKSSHLYPFVSLRYMRMQNRDFQSSNHNTNYSVDNQNLFIPKVGLRWSGEFQMPQSAWTWRPNVEGGYVWNLGNRNTDSIVTAGSTNFLVNYDIADKSSYYAKLGMEFVKKNFTGGIFYTYLNGTKVRNDKWNVNVSWAF